MADENKMSDIIKDLEKDWGTGVVKQGKGVVVCEPIPTGIMSVDRALGIGGFARGRITELYGNEGCGKTTLALHAIAQVQKSGGTAAFIDAEHAFDPVYADAIGVDCDALWFAQPNSGEEGLDVCRRFAKAGAVDLIVVDSVAALIPKEELDNPMIVKSYAPLPILMSKVMKHVSADASKSNTGIIFINQMRSKVGVTYGNPEQTPGGKALKFYASMRVELRRVQAIKQGDNVIGQRVKLKVAKNKVANPYVECEYDLYYGVGASPEADLIDMGKKLGIVKQSGSWYSFGDTKIGNGKLASMAALKDNEALYEELRYDVEQALNDQSSS